MRQTIVWAMALLALWPAGAKAQSTADRGRAILAKNCGGCHAVDATGESRHKAAPPFRDVVKRYPPADLEEALAEGLSTGHPDMPEFRFATRDVNRIVAHLRRLDAGR